MHTKSFFRRPATALLAFGLLVPTLAVTPASAGRKVERGLEPMHQPVVSRTDFVFDVAADGSGSLGPIQQSQLAAWFDALGLGYGDHVSLAGANGGTRALQDSIGDVVGRYGLLIEGDAPATAGEAPAGGVRIVVSRSTASVPGCPTWRDKSETNVTGGLSDNYGCASASNLAAMIADPRDLVDGRAATLDPKSTVSGKAIKVYKDKAPTGSGSLQAMSAGGN